MPLTSLSSSSKWPWLSASGGWRAMDKAGCSAWRGGAGTMPPGRAEWLRGADTCLRALRAKCITAAISFVMAANPNFNGWCPSGTACARCTQCRQTQRLRCCNHAQSTDDACWQCVGCMRRLKESGAFLGQSDKGPWPWVQGPSLLMLSYQSVSGGGGPPVILC